MFFDKFSRNFKTCKWSDLRVGDIVRINKNENLPADICIIFSSNESGIAFVDTKSLDGETNLKEKFVSPIFRDFRQENIGQFEGYMVADPPNDYLDSWEGNIHCESMGIAAPCNIRQLLLKGSVLKNTDYIIGICVYNGHHTKIMKNAKNPPIKMSNVMKTMNKILISIFIMQICVCIFFSVANVIFKMDNKNKTDVYIVVDNAITVRSFVTKFFTFVVAYSHLIPISLYVAMEIVKLLQQWFIFYDNAIFEKKYEIPAMARTSELIEELGQVQMIFSDKTGTLTQNSMVFKKFAVNGIIYGESDEENPLEIKVPLKKKVKITYYLGSICNK